jgi:hypothetical protein
MDFKQDNYELHIDKCILKNDGFFCFGLFFFFNIALL